MSYIIISYLLIQRVQKQILFQPQTAILIIVFCWSVSKQQFLDLENKEQTKYESYYGIHKVKANLFIDGFLTAMPYLYREIIKLR